VSCHHNHTEDIIGIGEKKLLIAIVLNVGLTFVQIAGGVVSGSLALIADALHNFGDAASLVVAYVAIKIGKRPADEFKHFGYKRAETVGALINLTTLVIVGIYLIYQAGERFINPQEISGWTVVWVAFVAFLVDAFTAALTFKESSKSMNIKAVYLHNLTDALASVGVMITGALILIFGWVWTDAAMTLVIAGYVLWQGFKHMPEVINVLMEGAPDGVDIEEIINAMEAVPGVENVHEVYIWRLNEHRNAMEAHVVLEDLKQMEDIKRKLKTLLIGTFQIERSTLEFEWGHENRGLWHEE
jgi:cobalt-zinc-cadmium efflux system protein